MNSAKHSRLFTLMFLKNTNSNVEIEKVSQKSASQGSQGAPGKLLRAALHLQANLENYYTTRVLTMNFVICEKSLAHDNISQRSAWMLLCGPAAVAPRPCGVTSLFTADTEEPRGRTELLCRPELH